MSAAGERAAAALDLVAKWRTLLAGWQLGTRPKGDPEADAVRDHREATIMLRAEVSALTAALLESGVLTQDDYLDHLERAALELSETFAARFPGFRAIPDGLSIDPAAAAQTMRGWRP